MITRVLLVEDSPTQAEALRAALEEGGYHVTVAHSGAAALRILESEPVDVVVSDIIMPGDVDGYELCRRIKQGEHHDLPVLLLTSLSDPLDIIRGLEAGADNFLTKPCAPDHLRERLSALLTTRRTRDQRRVRAGLAVYFMGREFTITAEREQILDLLVTTFEDAVRQNHELRQREDELLRSRVTLAGLYQVAVGLNACTNEQEVVDTALEGALCLPGVRGGWFLLYDGTTVRVAGARNLPPALSAPGALEGDCTCRRVLLAGKLDYVIDISHCEHLHEARTDGQEATYHACVPLQCGGRVLGVLNLVSHGHGHFTEEDHGILYSVGNQIAFTLERARLQNRLEQLVEERTAALRAEIEEHKHAQEALRLSDSILREIGNLVLVADGDSLIRYVSPSVQAVLGHEPGALLGDGWWLHTCPDPEERARLRDQAARQARGDLALAREPYERLIAGHDGTSHAILWTDSRGPDGLLIGVGYDVTERKRLEQQFHQAQKMEAVGRLAGGIAHDFNNVLSVIIGTADLTLLELDADGRTAADILAIKEAANRASQLTRQLLAFGRKQVLQPRVLNLNEIVTGMEGMLRRVLREDIAWTTRLATDLANVRMDPGQLEQVLMNLVVNARDAMPAGGTVTVETRNVQLDAEYAQAHPGVVSGDYVLLAVSDTGVGMDESTLTRVFEPFFTTKPPGEGTGLGLATVHGIIRQSGGHIWVYSEPAKGTSFKIYLPRVTEAAESVAAAPPPLALASGTETVLVVEDEDAVRSLIVRALTRAGYSAIEARNGNEALALASSHAGPIGLLLTDVVMPGLSARALAQQFGALRPDAKMLFMSGYTDDAISHQGLLEPGINYLEKPFTPGDLLRRVRQVLDRPAVPR